ncbi:cold shock domain-containing protein [Rubrobacter marinus]|uniref:cold shock domain-containing protein n=1 Tax=Rubrobacter marinus TaxID=2653852 RepID=UPI001D18CD64|nr:cold shock domain-containing protein [Rubrobacter marinus]
MTESKKRIALKPHMKQIREWVDAGKTDDWIADALGTSASSVQSFRSRNDIYRRDRGPREPASVFEGVLDHGERDGWGLWLDPAIADDPIWKEYWSGVDSVVVKVAEDSIVLEVAAGGSHDGNGASTPTVASLAVEASVEVPAELALPVADEPAAAEPEAGPEPGRERGRVKWFDAEKGYGFLVRPTGEDLFVHHSEVEGEASDLGPGGEVEYVVGRNDRGPNARSVRLMQ